MSSVTAESLRAELEQHGPPRRGRRFPHQLRVNVAEFAAARRALGDSTTGVARELGMNVETLQRWMPLATAPSAFVPVRVAATNTRGLAIVHPRTGLRVEGLGLNDVVELLRRLE